MTLADDIAVCVGCGLCLPHCPTFRITGEEAHSPRGRIALIKATLDVDGATPTTISGFLDTCVQCRGCEPACPSGVPYGRIFETRRRMDEASGRRPSPMSRMFLAIVDRPRLLTFVGRLSAAVNSIPLFRSIVPRPFRLTIPWDQGPRVRRNVASPSLWLFTGCVMDSWFRSVHRATLELLDMLDETVSTPIDVGLCCGALHLHAGSESETRARAALVMASMPGDAPIIVNSAGCGAMLKEYGQLIGSPEAEQFSSRVRDIHEWIDEHCVELTSRIVRVDSPSFQDRTFIVQEPCHLRNVQRISIAAILEKFVPVTRLEDDDVCCGAGGAYSILQPDMSRQIRDRKVSAIHAADSDTEATVVTANPGCHLHLAAAGFELKSSVEVVLSCLSPMTRDRR